MVLACAVRVVGIRTTDQRSVCRSSWHFAVDCGRWWMSFVRELFLIWERASWSWLWGDVSNPLSLRWNYSLRSLPDPHRAAQVTEGQPFFLHALAQSLRLMGDPDVDSIDTTIGSNFIEGVHVGHTSPLGPTPQVFRPRIKQAVYDESDWTWCMDNYFRGDEKEAAQILEQHFKEEELEGRMLPMSFKAAVQKYPGSSLRIAAQGILDKPDGGHRIIHDGTHWVQLNNEINIVDRLENPGPGELAALSVAAGERVIFGLNADVAKAHRRVKVKEEDWGVLACKTSAAADVVWLKKLARSAWHRRHTGGHVLWGWLVVLHWMLCWMTGSSHWYLWTTFTWPQVVETDGYPSGDSSLSWKWPSSHFHHKFRGILGGL